MDELVAVVGMHRSGTSATAHLVHALGVPAVGSGKALVRADKFNPLGYWEPPELIMTNTYLLNYLGCDWRTPLIPPPGWEQSRALRPLRARLSDLFRRMGGPRRSWKDPRLSLTLPFWQTVTPPTRYVVCLRNPLGVWNSLRRREGLSLEKAGELWRVYTALTIRDTVGHPRLFVSYEDLLRDPVPETERIRAFVGGSGDSAVVAAQVVQPTLDHAGEASEVALAPDVDGLWQAVEAARASRWEADSVAALNGAAAAALVRPIAASRKARIRHQVRWLAKSVRLAAATAREEMSGTRAIVLPSGRVFGQCRTIEAPEQY